MVANVYYLIAGILSILFSFTHALNGHNTILNLVHLSNIDISSKTTIFYVWHIITIENIAFGIAFLIMAFSKRQSRFKFAAWLIAIIILARWAVILGSTMFKNISGITGILIDSIAIIVFVTLIIIGTMKKEKIQV